jgi:hypothetical protein
MKKYRVTLTRKDLELLEEICDLAYAGCKFSESADQNMADTANVNDCISLIYCIEQSMNSSDKRE